MVDYIRWRLEDAGRTLMMLPMPKDGLPAGEGTRWPFETVARFWEMLGGLSEEQREELAEARNRIPLRATAEQITRMDEALGWLIWIPVGPRRRIVFARMLIDPRSDRQIVSWAELSRRVGVHRHTCRKWHQDGLELIAGKFWIV